MSQQSPSGGYSIFHGTMADMTFPEVMQAAADRAVVLWGLGVIEQHGPHLPLGTDVYMPSALLRRVQERPPLRESIVVDMSLHGAWSTLRR